jgi:zinc protease
MTVPAPAPPRPRAGPPRPYRFPGFETLELPNGLRVLVAPVRKLPVVSTLAVIDAGAEGDPPGKEGLGMLTARGLAEGTTAFDGSELSRRFERLGGALDVDADWDADTAGVTVLTDHFEEAAGLLASVLRTPAFPDRELERLREERLAELLQLRTEPRGLADEMFTRALYATTSRYRLPAGGVEQTVASLTRADVVEQHHHRFGPRATTMVVVGDVAPEQVERVMLRAFGDWTTTTRPAGAVDTTAAHRTRSVRLVAKRDAAQSELRVGHVGLPRKHPDYIIVSVMNAILGGLFSSRINLNLRERHAYTYGAFSAFEWRHAAGPFVVSTAVKSEVTTAALREIVGEIERIREAPVSDGELTLAVDYLAGVFPIRYETTAAIAMALAARVVHDLPEDYFDTYRDRIRAVTAADVRAVAERHLHPDALQVVCVGDPDAVGAPLEREAFGPVEVTDADPAMTASVPGGTA